MHTERKEATRRVTRGRGVRGSPEAGRKEGRKEAAIPGFHPCGEEHSFLVGAVLTRTLGLSGDYSAFWVERVA